MQVDRKPTVIEIDSDSDGDEPRKSQPMVSCIVGGSSSNSEEQVKGTEFTNNHAFWDPLTLMSR